MTGWKVCDYFFSFADAAFELSKRADTLSALLIAVRVAAYDIRSKTFSITPR